VSELTATQLKKEESKQPEWQERLKMREAKANTRTHTNSPQMTTGKTYTHLPTQLIQFGDITRKSREQESAMCMCVKITRSEHVTHLSLVFASTTSSDDEANHE